jgi:uncharacterized phiE125 gp8 family phage protein
VYGLSRLAPPTEEPVSLERAKEHLRVSSAVTADDNLITLWIKAAREMTEDFTGRAWVTSTWRLTLANWPADDDGYGGCVRLPVQPATAVTGVVYRDANGDSVTMASDGSAYQTWLDHRPPLIAAAPRTVWPTVETGRLAAVQVTFTAGYGGAAAVPEAAKAAMLLCLGYWYENRGDGRDPTAMLGLPQTLGIPPGARNLLTTLMTGAY